MGFNGVAVVGGEAAVKGFVEVVFTLELGSGAAAKGFVGVVFALELGGGAVAKGFVELVGGSSVVGVPDQYLLFIQLAGVGSKRSSLVGI